MLRAMGHAEAGATSQLALPLMFLCGESMVIGPQIVPCEPARVRSQVAPN